MTDAELLEALRNAVGARHVLTDDKQTERFRKGFRSGEGEALAVVQPATVLEQWKVLQACVAADKIVILQAANTGLTEGSTPKGQYDRDVVLINTRRMDRLHSLDAGRQVLALPGATLFALELASRYYDDASDLGAQILRRDQTYPETSLISQFETGSIDAAFAYRSMAVERGYEYVELPAQIDLSDPRYAEEWYSKPSYTLPSGQEVRGGLISYGSTVRHVSDAAVAVFDAHTTGTYLEDHGFLLREQFPAYTGEVPRRVTRTADRSDENRSRLDRDGESLSAAVSDITVLT